MGIVRTDTGAPLPDARALFSRGPVALPDIAAVTDEHGRFSLTAPAPGTYELTVVAGGQTTTRRLEVAPGEVRVVIEIEMGRPQRN